MQLIQTVRGPIDPGELGFTLTHEHILCDFIGAGETGKHRWNPDEVADAILPNLKAIRRSGVTGFADCSPAYIGRDPELLRRLSEEADIHILTNTGYYGAANDKFVPKHAYSETADQLAARWIKEWVNGIEGTGIRPGFIKIGVDRIQDVPMDSISAEKAETSGGVVNADNRGLSEIDAKLVRAAAKTHKRTGLRIASHTGQGIAALAQIAILEEEGVDPSAYIFVHCDGEVDQEYHFQVAEKGGWIEYDGIRESVQDTRLQLVSSTSIEYPDDLLLSQDSGWYYAGEPNGGNIRNYSYLPDVFIPKLREQGMVEELIQKLTVTNPAKAFAIEI